jgi:5-methyltetrahydrofolate--homocysteine methyltransferase
MLQRLLGERGVLLADGGLGTGLFARGLTSGDSPELWNVEHPERVTSVHRSFVEAGSDIILTNSFGGNRYRLKLHGAEGRVRELNRAAASVARAAAGDAARSVLVAGSIGPTGEILAPLGSLGQDEASEAFAEQAMALAEGGVDVLWIETMSAGQELAAAVAGAMRTGLPIVTTMSFDTNGRTMMGTTPEAAVDLFRDLPTKPVAYGANCGVGPAQLLMTLLAMAGRRSGDEVIVAKGNCGVPVFRDGQIHYSGTPEVMAAYARLARDAGARIIGGCCGTGPEHLVAMRGELDHTPSGRPPDTMMIESALGPVVAPSVDAAPRERAGRRRRS